jgi:tetratricopeptide (TPR) repeat protein
VRASAARLEPQTVGRRTALAGLLVIAIGVPLYFSPLFYEYQIPKAVIYQTVAVLMAAVWVIAMALDGELRIIDTRLYYAMAGFLAASFISLFQAYNLFQGLETLFDYLCGFLVAILVFHLIRSSRQLNLLAGTMIGVAGVVAAIGLLQHNDLLSLYTRWQIPISTIGNVNFVAEYFNVVFPIAAACLIGWTHPWARALSLTSCFLMSCHLVVLGSRGGWLGTAVALAVIGLAWLFRTFRVSRRALDRGLAVVIVTALAWPIVEGLLSGIPAGAERNLKGLTTEYWRRMADRSDDALKLRDDSSRQRVLLWEDTLRLIFDRPFVGVGVGNFEYNIPKYTSRQSLEVKRRMEQRTGKELMAYRAHNEYLEIWAESGILGIIAFGAILYQLLGAVIGLLRRYMRREEGVLALGLSAAVAATLAHSFFSTNLQDPASASHFWIVFGMVWALKLNAEGESRIPVLATGSGKAAFGVSAACLAACGLAVYLGLQSLLGAYYFHLGGLWFRQKAYGQAAAAFRRAADFRFKDEFAAYQALGVSYYNQERWGEAAEAFRKSFYLHRNNPTVHYHLGVCLGHLGDLQGSVTHLRRATQLDPLSGKYLAELGKALGLSGDAAGAVEALEAARRLEPGDASALHALGRNYKDLGRLDEAIDAYSRAAAIDPDDAEIQNSLAVAYVAQGTYASARDVFQRLAEQHPEAAGYRVNLAVALLNLRQFREALAACEEAIRLAPDNVRAYGVAGAVFQAVGDVANARKVYQRALRISPDNTAIRASLQALDEDR